MIPKRLGLPPTAFAHDHELLPRSMRYGGAAGCSHMLWRLKP
jgi:hypothetical protein